MVILGIHKDPWHNTGAAILYSKKGKVTVSTLSEERLDRIKDSRNFPEKSIKACMEQVGVKSLNDIDLVVTDYFESKDICFKDYNKKVCRTDTLLHKLPKKKIKVINHHFLHACSVYYSSPFKEAAILIVDGRGSLKETQSLFYATENKIRLISKTHKIGIGLLYATITEEIGFKTLEEGKTMGLAPHGAKIKKKFFNFFGKYNGIETSYEKICVNQKYEVKSKFKKKINSFLDKAKVAYEVQKEAENAMLHLTKFAKSKTKSENLCISGGVALNCVANNILKDTKLFKNVYINPGASDTGIPLGAVYHGYFHHYKKLKKEISSSPYLGLSYSNKKIKTSLKLLKKNKKIKISKDKNLKKTLKILLENKAVGFFQGRSETGPRALGNRSILMSPLKEKNRYILNKKIKLREEFRPFAPVITKEEVSNFFHFKEESPYMLYACKVKKSKKKLIPAVIHLDDTARIQTITQSSNKKIYNLLKMFEKKTKVPVLINTSFNIKNEPIVETPDNAINCFLNTKIDALFLQDYIIEKI
jgi:carbamoyltransferase